jgi:hypothetical protein
MEIAALIFNLLFVVGPTVDDIVDMFRTPPPAVTRPFDARPVDPITYEILPLTPPAPALPNNAPCPNRRGCPNT